SEAPTGVVRPPNAVDVSIDYCLFDLPEWFAYKNDGYDWVALPVPFLGFTPIQFAATPKVAIAFYHNPNSFYTYEGLQIFYLTAAELQSQHCTLPIAMKSYSGTVANIDADDHVTMS